MCACVCLQAVAKAFGQVLLASPDVGVQAEVLDSVFDVFGESDSSAAVVTSSGLLATLCAVQPVFADKAGQAHSWHMYCDNHPPTVVCQLYLLAAGEAAGGRGVGPGCG